jgi:hypothetical protein
LRGAEAEEHGLRFFGVARLRGLAGEGGCGACLPWSGGLRGSITCRAVAVFVDGRGAEVGRWEAASNF